MADFTAIPDANLAPDKPARSIDALALRDNPIAIAEGATGAPRIQTAAIQNLAVTNAKIGAGAVTSAKLATGTGERDWVLARNAGADAGAVGTYALLVRSGMALAITAGSTYAGSGLRYAGIQYNAATDDVRWSGTFGGTPAGTWLAVGTQGFRTGYYSGTMFLRIS